jgi:adenylate kinase family enzyme
MGASGSGATSLGRALAAALALPHHDADDCLWLPTVPPYRTLREFTQWLRRPVLRLDGSQPLSDLVPDVCAALG